MNKIKRAYYYFFYKIYKSIEYTSELGGGKFWSDFKTVISIGALEIWLLLSIGAYYTVVTKTKIELSLFMPAVYIPLMVILILNYFSFIHTDIWKKYNKEFDNFSKEKNRKGGLIVWSTIVLIIGNLIFSYYLLFAQAKQNHTGLYAPEVVAKERREDSLQKAQQIEKLRKIYGEDNKR